MALNIPRPLTGENIESIVQKSLDQIFADGISIREYVLLYTTSYELCKAPGDSPNGMVGAGQANLVYRALERYLRNYANRKLTIMKEIQDDEERLRFYKASWDKYALAANIVARLFTYMNHHWVKRYNEHVKDNGGTEFILEIYPLVVYIWKDEFYVKNDLQIVSSALKLVQKDRDGESGLDESLIQAVVDSLVESGLEFKEPENPGGFNPTTTKTTVHPPGEELPQWQNYVDYFEKPLLEETANYYRKEVATVKLEEDIMGYLVAVERRRKDEEHRSHSYLLEIITNKRLQKCLDTVFLEEQLPMIKEDFRNLLEADRLVDMHAMFLLCWRVEKAVDLMKKEFRDYVAEKGRLAYAALDETERKDPNTYVQTGLKIHGQFRQVVKAAFEDEGGFLQHFDEGCSKMINRNVITEAFRSLSKTPDLLARHVDALMKKGGDENVEQTMDCAMTFFGYVEDKDLFQKYYNMLLSKRLLHAQSANDDLESSFISRLKTACGHEYVYNSMKMFHDISVSKESSAKFKEEHGDKVQVETDFQILSTGSWPCKATIAFNIPISLEEAMGSYNSFYSTIHQGRKLSWVLQLARGEVSTKCFKRKYIFSGSVAQIVLLLKYNDGDSFAFEDLCEDLNMQKELLKITLDSLSSTKAPILTITGNGEYKLNDSFAPKRHKIDLLKFVSSKSMDGAAAKKESQDLAKTLEEDRKIVLQAAIVRVMKMRRRLQHTALINEVIEQVNARFQPQVSMIKMCIGLLMEKDYLKRASNNNDYYEYIT